MLGARLAGFTYRYTGQAEHVNIRVYQNTKFYSNINQGVSYISSVSIVLSVGLVSIVGMSLDSNINIRSDTKNSTTKKQSYKIELIYIHNQVSGSTALDNRTDVDYGPH